MSRVNTAYGNLNPTGEVSRVYLIIVDVMLTPTRRYLSQILVIEEMILCWEPSRSLISSIKITKMSILVCDNKLMSKVIAEVN